MWGLCWKKVALTVKTHFNCSLDTHLDKEQVFCPYSAFIGSVLWSIFLKLTDMEPLCSSCVGCRGQSWVLNYVSHQFLALAEWEEQTLSETMHSKVSQANTVLASFLHYTLLKTFSSVAMFVVVVCVVLILICWNRWLWRGIKCFKAWDLVYCH